MAQPNGAPFFSLSIHTYIYSDAVADCSEVAYEKLGVDAAKSILLLDSDNALSHYAQEKHPEWVIGNGFVHFGNHLDHKPSKASDVPSLSLISETLSYATELERIV